MQCDFSFKKSQSKLQSTGIRDVKYKILDWLDAVWLDPWTQIGVLSDHTTHTHQMQGSHHFLIHKRQPTPKINSLITPRTCKLRYKDKALPLAINMTEVIIKSKYFATVKALAIANCQGEPKTQNKIRSLFVQKPQC